MTAVATPAMTSRTCTSSAASSSEPWSETRTSLRATSVWMRSRVLVISGYRHQPKTDPAARIDPRQVHPRMAYNFLPIITSRSTAQRRDRPPNVDRAPVWSTARSAPTPARRSAESVWRTDRQGARRLPADRRRSRPRPGRPRSAPRTSRPCSPRATARARQRSASRSGGWSGQRRRSHTGGAEKQAGRVDEVDPSLT